MPWPRREHLPAGTSEQKVNKRREAHSVDLLRFGEEKKKFEVVRPRMYNKVIDWHLFFTDHDLTSSPDSQ